jgi:hypothetical protein
MGTGGLQDVMGRIAPEHSRLLRLSGEERVDLSPPPGVMVEDRVTYASVPGPMPVELARLLSVAALPRFIVLLHSGAAARHFIQECARLGLSRARITAITIGPRVTEICHNADGWHSIHTAKTPGDAAMLALAAQTCKTSNRLGCGLDGVWPNNERRISQSAPRAAPVGLRRTDLRFCDGLCAGRGRCRFASWQLGWLRHGAMPMMSANGPTLNPMGEAQINARIAELDRKLGAIETQAALAGGQAGRAEALLVSIATRRAIERGTPLGYLEGQLRTRFGEALPQVVNSVIAFGRAPITQDRLSAQLDVLAPQLTGPDETQSTWSKVRRDLSGLFILHSETRPAAPDPKLRLDHARLCLREGRIEDAIADVRLLPGAKAAQGWINDAQRYAAAMHALDALDTSALLEPKGCAMVRGA